MSQLMHAVGMRDVNRSVFKMNHLENVYMIIAWALGIALQALVTEIPYFVSLFGTSRLSLTEWLSLGVLASMPLIVHELLVFSEALQNKAPKGTRTLQETQKGQQHENGTPQPGEAV